MGEFDGKTAVVTGGTAGIGLTTAQRLAAEGAYVFITGRRKPELDAAVASIGAASATGVLSDVSVAADLDRLYETVRGQGRRVDVLYTNAGGGTLGTLEQVTEEDFDRTFAINVKGVLFAVQKALPLLNDGASVIVPGSSAVLKGDEAMGVYAATKAAVRSFARTWANELRGRDIRVNAIAPGPIETPGILNGFPDAEQAKAYFASKVPLGRMGRTEEIAEAILFLASSRSSFMTGANLSVDGGLTEI